MNRQFWLLKRFFYFMKKTETDQMFKYLSLHPTVVVFSKY